MHHINKKALQILCYETHLDEDWVAVGGWRSANVSTKLANKTHIWLVWNNTSTSNGLHTEGLVHTIVTTCTSFYILIYNSFAPSPRYTLLTKFH